MYFLPYRLYLALSQWWYVYIHQALPFEPLHYWYIQYAKTNIWGYILLNIITRFLKSFRLSSNELTSTWQTWKFELLGNHDIIADVAVTALAFTQDGPRGASLPKIRNQVFYVKSNSGWHIIYIDLLQYYRKFLPIIIVHAASLEVFLLTVTLLTLIRCGCCNYNVKRN